MKQIFLVAILTAGFAFPKNLHAQCPGCSINYSYTVPGLYPDTFPDAVQNQYYDLDVTFVMLTDTMGFDILSFTITGVSGLPQGVDWECNSSSNGCVYDPQQSIYGCVKFCGTPTQIGLFTVTIFVVAEVDLVGSNPIQFTKSFLVLPAGGGNSTFVFNPASDCGSATVQFEALIDGAPNPTEWLWDFGNGNTGNQQIPPTQTYFSPWEYEVSLTTNIYNYTIAQVDIYDCNDNYCGDIEEPNIFGCVGDPDPFFEVYDAQSNVILSVGYVDDTQSASWTGLSTTLNNPPYSITFWDYDPVSQNDNLGSFPFNVSSTGVINFNSGNGTVASVTIGQILAGTFFDTDTVLVFANPPPATIVAPFASVCEGETIILVCNGCSGFSVQWFQDGQTLLNETDTFLMVTTGGNYHLSLTSSEGCSSLSDTMAIGFYPNPPTPTFTINGNDLTCFLTGYSFQWYLNGSTIPGATSFTYSITQNGNYYLSATNSYGCTSFSDTVYLNTVGLSDMPEIARGLLVYPNPSEGSFNVSLQLAAETEVQFHIMDMLGRKFISKYFDAGEGSFLAPFEITDMPSGEYLLEIVTEQGVVVQKISRQ